ncbi:MAG: NUDIX domain-containing protein [Candidatus Zixiibacteriota bacterium]|nr:MAG: NUDIX domain-containing protein [candidate division Zixibacteria bacterium]
MKEENSPEDLLQGVPITAPFISVYLIKHIEGQARFLIIKRDREPYKNIWQPVTGRIEKGEKAWQAALREIKEETGLTPDRFYSANFIEKFYDLKNEVIAHCPAFVGFMDNDMEIRLSVEHSKSRWVKADEAIEKVVFTEQKKAIAHVKKYYIDDTPPEFLRVTY